MRLCRSKSGIREIGNELDACLCGVIEFEDLMGGGLAGLVVLACAEDDRENMRARGVFFPGIFILSETRPVSSPVPRMEDVES